MQRAVAKLKKRHDHNFHRCEKSGRASELASKVGQSVFFTGVKKVVVLGWSEFSLRS
jgi:hypothetical protein